MEHAQKLSFLQNMAHMALTHAASTPNVPTPKGGMSHDKMLQFVQQIAQKGLQHLDAGGAPTTTTTGLGVLGSPLKAINNITQNGFQAQAAPIVQGTNAGQLAMAYGQTQNALVNQAGLVNQTAAGTAQGLGAQIALSQQLAAEAAGRGPNPAQAALNQSTGQNIAQQAALAAGQRGAGANAGLIAAQNAQQGAATQQNAIGQAATMQAQQQLAAQNAQANLAATQVGQGATAIQNQNQQLQNEQNILQGANTSANNAGVAMQANINNANAGVSEANQNASNNLSGGILGGVSSALQSIFAEGGMVKMDKGGNVLDANARAHIAPHNFALPGNRYPIHDEAHARNALARVSQHGTPDGVFCQEGVSSPEKAKGRTAVQKKYPNMGKGKKMAGGGAAGDDTPSWQNTPSDVSSGPSIPATATPPAAQSSSGSSGSSGGGGAGAIGLLAALDTGGDPSRPKSFREHYFNFCNGALMKSGGNVQAETPNQTAKVPGDSLKNDKIPAMLSQGEFVIDRETMKDPGPMGQMARALAQHITKRNAA